MAGSMTKKSLAKIPTVESIRNNMAKEQEEKKEAAKAMPTGTVSERLKKTIAESGDIIPDEKMNDVVKGAQFGEAVLGEEGLGRLGTDSSIQDLEKQAAELSKGFSSQEMQARKEKSLEAITSGTQSQSRAAQAALARAGVKGQAAGAQLGQIALGGVQARGNLERDLLIANREAQQSGFRDQAELVTGVRQFDISQAAKEKDIALQAGLGFAGLGSIERSADKAALAQIMAAEASRSSSCFLEGTKVKMHDNSYKNIEDVKITDFLCEGGVVYTIMSSLTSEVFKYGDVKVTGNHAVKEDGKWIRVRDSKEAIPLEGIFPVFNLSTENHKIITECGTIFADYDETNYFSDINDSESLEVLNGNGSKILEGRAGI